MLVDLKTIKWDGRTDLTPEELERVIGYSKIQNGIFEISHWNPELVFKGLKNADYWPSWRLNYEEVLKELERCGLPEQFNSYGVCDYPRQVLSVYPSLETCEDKFAITCVRIRRDGQPDWGGWRWHKWGEYIGTQHPQREYIFDEPDIEEVFTFKVHHLEQ